MSAISEPLYFPIDGMLFRSLLPRNQQMRVPDSSRGRRHRFETGALQLASHLAMTSFLFLMLAIAVWITSFAFHSLHSVHPFPNELLRFLDRLEVWLVYADGAWICCALQFGFLQYVLNVLRGHS